MLENLINVDRFNITFARYLSLYAVCGYFLRLSLWVFVVLFCSPLGVCNQELEKLEFLEELKNLELLEPLEKPTPHQTKKKNKVGVAQNPPLKNSDFRASPPNRAKGRCVADVARWLSPDRRRDKGGGEVL